MDFIQVIASFSPRSSRLRLVEAGWSLRPCVARGYEGGARSGSDKMKVYFHFDSSLAIITLVY
ncbi:MAG: hypothetical protein A2909_00380 [Candidatus Tagabacteria bacterium RIFCSPLOWO2_01_FULL_39_11]|uniref:Uncharacterized protein n=1 Tax=Candidatus Tagabacteria bacterium RIFCSPLOWO2_01_FULL_39_11 TaxID=1802295 RepID=A0A1G2LP23_9BACT|nr:MAG: hypothetical protein A2909_00380 [Candidatus Tagabacteria bacterium RIFCSPLOWO2_01_FULL_39_11]